MPLLCESIKYCLDIVVITPATPDYLQILINRCTNRVQKENACSKRMLGTHVIFKSPTATQTPLLTDRRHCKIIQSVSLELRAWATTKRRHGWMSLGIYWHLHVVTLMRVHADRAFDRKSIPKSEIKVKLVEKINILVTGSMSFTKEGKKWDRGSNPLRVRLAISTCLCWFEVWLLSMSTNNHT